MIYETLTTIRDMPNMIQYIKGSYSSIKGCVASADMPAVMTPVQELQEFFDKDNFPVYNQRDSKNYDAGKNKQKIPARKEIRKPKTYSHRSYGGLESRIDW